MKFANDNRHRLIDFSKLEITLPFAKARVAGITSLSLVLIMLAVMLLSVIVPLTQIVITPQPVQAATVPLANTSVGTSYWTVPTLNASTGNTTLQVLVMAGGGGTSTSGVGTYGSGTAGQGKNGGAAHQGSVAWNNAGGGMIQQALRPYINSFKWDLR